MTEAEKLENLARCSLRFGLMCDKIKGRKDWALDAKLKAWKLQKEAQAAER